MGYLAALVLGLACFTCVVACQDSEEEPPPAAASEMVSPGATAAAEDEDEEELELMQEPESVAPLPIDEMDQAALETACFEGRQDACDRLGH